MIPEPALVKRIVDGALAEDLAWGDLTTDSLVDPGQTGVGRLVAKQDGVLAGIDVAALVFTRNDPTLETEIVVADGSRVTPHTTLAIVRGRVASILRAERVSLNFVQRMSGIATMTASYVAATEGTSARIVDTRKTTPGLRVLEKYAVRVGGAANHRFCLSDGVLIKDNHLAALRARGRGLKEAVALARAGAPHMVRIEVEVESLEEAREALEAGADAILLDNMSPEEMRRCVDLIGGRAMTEASGGITLATVRDVAESGVDLISAGAITHSVRALDISLDLEVEAAS